MVFRNRSFAQRIAGYFGALFLAAMGVLFFLWYFGVASWGLVGAGTQSLGEAMTLLEVKADLQQTLIGYNIRERRGDILVMSESETLAKLLNDKGPRLQAEVERLYDGLQRAYPDRYRRLLIVDPTSHRILASNTHQEVGHAFDATLLIQRATQVGATEIVEPMSSTPGVPVLAIARQLHLRDTQGEPSGPVVGILVVYADLQQFVGGHFMHEASGDASPVRETSLLLNASGDVLARFPPQGPHEDLSQMSAHTVLGFEGTLQQSSPSGQRRLVVYRHIALSGAQGWRLVLYASEADALGSLQSRVRALALAGLLLTLAALLAIALAARRVAKPLNQLAQTAAHLGVGDLAARAPSHSGDSREVAMLSQSFNAMARNIQQAQQSLEQRVQERTAELQRSAAMLARTGEIARVGGWELDLATLQVYFSPESLKIIEVNPEQGLTLEQVMEMIEPQARDATHTAMQAAISSGTPWSLEVPMVTAKGRHIWIRSQGAVVVVDGKASTLQGAMHDISEQKQAEKTEQFRSHILELLARGEALPSLLEALVLGVQALDPLMLCSILLLDSNGHQLGKGVAPSLPEFYNAALDGVEIGMGVGSCGTAAFTGERVVVADIATHPYWAEYKDLAASADLGACWSQPIRASSGQVLGTFAIYHRAPHTPDDGDIALIEQSARLASIAIERSLAAAQLRESEAHYRLLTEDASDVVWRQDANNVFTYISPSDERMRGYRADEVVGCHVFDLLTDEGVALIKSRIAQRVEVDALGAQSQPEVFEVQQRCKDGGLIWTEVMSKVDRDADGVVIGFHGISRDISHRRQADAELRIAAIAFESQEGVFVADANWFILRVNRAFSDITGYAAFEAVGQQPRELLGSVEHDGTFYEHVEHSIARSGSWQGEIWDRRKNGEVFPAWVIITAVLGADAVLTHYVATLTDITQRKANEEQIRSLAFYDPLTQLPNRRLLMDRLEKALAAGARHRRNGALLFVDLDNFKTLNDTLGHDKGDLLLQQVAQRLGTCVRDCDTVARLGGDEFVVMLEDLSEHVLEAATQAELVGAKILATLNQHYQLAGFEHHSTPSIGVTLFGEESESIDEPLKRADLAMYQAKAAGRNTLRFYDPQMQAVVNARVAMEGGLREALAQGQFLLHYQPQVDAQGHTTGAEALVRWMHPERGMVSPAAFIPLAEETTLILPLGSWVMETACLQLARWGQQSDTAHLSLSVNVSPRQFHQVDFVAQVMAVVARTGANPLRLKLELTEGLMVTNVEDVIAKMDALKAHGVGFSLDDFGTGYSSLSYLKRLPLDQLKIDQGFVRDILVDPNDAAIAKMVIVLADSLGLACIAEGVETEAQREFLAAQGCCAYQGYLFSRPLPIADFEAFVQAAVKARA